MCDMETLLGPAEGLYYVSRMRFYANSSSPRLSLGTNVNKREELSEPYLPWSIRLAFDSALVERKIQYLSLSIDGKIRRGLAENFGRDIGFVRTRRL